MNVRSAVIVILSIMNVRSTVIVILSIMNIESIAVIRSAIVVSVVVRSANNYHSVIVIGSVDLVRVIFFSFDDELNISILRAPHNTDVCDDLKISRIFINGQRFVFSKLQTMLKFTIV